MAEGLSTVLPSRVAGWMVCGLVLLAGVCGCQQHVADNMIANPGIEEPLEGNGLPRGWAFSVSSGEYKHETAESSQSGKLALVMAGSGGAAEVNTNATPVTAGTVLECEAWLQTQLVKDGEPGVFARFSQEDKDDRSPMIRINPKSKDWQKIHFYCSADHDCSAMLAIRLGGEGLVRIDDVSMRLAPQLVASGLTSPRTFDEVDEKGDLKEWTHVSQQKKGTYKLVKDGGSTIARMEGNGGWSVLASRRAITTKPTRILLQGALRVTDGAGHLKIDYIKKNNCFKSTLSPAGKKDWTFVSVESDPALVAEADAIRATLSVAGGGEYSAEFDSIDIFIEH